MANDSTPEYNSYTRSHYQDEVVARDYAARQRLSGSLVGGVIATLERCAVRRALRSLHCSSTASVLDVPSGAGKLVGILNLPTRTYVAADVSQEMLHLLDAACHRFQGDAAAIAIRRAGVEYAICLRLLHRVPREVFTSIVSELLRVAKTGIVMSYAGPPRVPALHRLLQRVTRRGVWNLVVHPDELQELVGELGGARVVADRSISFGITSERVAAIAKT